MIVQWSKNWILFQQPAFCKLRFLAITTASTATFFLLFFQFLVFLSVLIIWQSIYFLKANNIPYSKNTLDGTSCGVLRQEKLIQTVIHKLDKKTAVYCHMAVYCRRRRAKVNINEECQIKLLIKHFWSKWRKHYYVQLFNAHLLS